MWKRLEKFVAEDIHLKRVDFLSLCFKGKLKEVGAERNLKEINYKYKCEPFSFPLNCLTEA